MAGKSVIRGRLVVRSLRLGAEPPQGGGSALSGREAAGSAWPPEFGLTGATSLSLPSPRVSRDSP